MRILLKIRQIVLFVMQVIFWVIYLKRKQIDRFIRAAEFRRLYTALESFHNTSTQTVMALLRQMLFLSQQTGQAMAVTLYGQVGVNAQKLSVTDVFCNFQSGTVISLNK